MHHPLEPRPTLVLFGLAQRGSLETTFENNLLKIHVSYFFQILSFHVLLTGT